MLTRRKLLQLAGAAGGASVLYDVAALLGMAPLSTARAATLQLQQSSGGRKVLILGAGVAGLVSAYELRKAGYAVEVLEAAHRIGGRSLTLRHGDLVDEIGNRQVCEFDDDPHSYFNAGPARIPVQHRNLLGYCRELGVELQPFINDNPSAWLQYDGFNNGARMRQRAFAADARGFIAELATKTTLADGLDQPFTAAERDQLLEFLARFGDLGDSGRYLGSMRAGQIGDGLMQHADVSPPTALLQLLKSDFWRIGMVFGQSEAQSSVLQPVGGMDRIVHALAEQVDGAIQLGCQVAAIETNDERVHVRYRRAGREEIVSGDYCLNSIPGQLLAGTHNNFSAKFKSALDSRPRGKLSKIGLQMSRRFWEDEEIYGGISWTGQDIGQIMYPPHGFHGQRGVLVGGYILSEAANDRFIAMTAEQRLAMARAQGEKLHPGYSGYVENGVSVAWYRMNHMLGCTARELDEATQKILIEPQGRHYLIGDQVALHAGWQESAVLSAHQALLAMQQHERATAGSAT